ncbi:MAG: GNAT family N-acetyltransferase [Burkholderiales bacterium]|nr:GNAT family N-acetyltransferase [Burkholderiales bacterium]
MQIRDFQSDDTDVVNELAFTAFTQFENEYADWNAFSQNLRKMSLLASTGEIIVAIDDGRIVGAVAYVGPGKPKANFFDPAWPIIRMLVVAPDKRGKGIGRLLTDECIRRAKRDKANSIALHTSPIMKNALSMYLRMGFALLTEAPPIHGVQYGVYIKSLN